MKGVGNSNTVGALFIAPGADPIPSKGTCTVESVLGGRALLRRYSGDFMGEKFEGILLPEAVAKDRGVVRTAA